MEKNVPLPPTGFTLLAEVPPPPPGFRLDGEEPVIAGMERLGSLPGPAVPHGAMQEVTIPNLGLKPKLQAVSDVAGKAVENAKSIYTALAESGTIGVDDPYYAAQNPITPDTRSRLADAAQTPLLPLSEALQPNSSLRPAAQALESITSPIGAAAAGAVGAAQLIPGLGPVVNAAITAMSAKGAVDSAKRAKVAYDAGDFNQAAQELGVGGVETLLGALAARASARGLNTAKQSLDTALTKWRARQPTPAVESVTAGNAPGLPDGTPPGGPQVPSGGGTPQQPTVRATPGTEAAPTEKPVIVHEEALLDRILNEMEGRDRLDAAAEATNTRTPIERAVEATNATVPEPPRGYTMESSSAAPPAKESSTTAPTQAPVSNDPAAELVAAAKARGEITPEIREAARQQVAQNPELAEALAPLTNEARGDERSALSSKKTPLVPELQGPVPVENEVLRTSSDETAQVHVSSPRTENPVESTSGTPQAKDTEPGDSYDQAVDAVRNAGKASAQIIQRKLRVGYEKAAAMLNRMESDGIVGPAAEGTGLREVLKKEPASESKDETAETKKYDYASTQVNLPAPVAKHVLDAGKRIPDAKLAADGRETEPHVTVKYGLHGEDPAEVAKLLEGQGPITVKLGKASLFQNEDADVLKVDVDSEDLHKLNGLIKGALPHTENHPEYTPHVTIAYLKPGEGKKYAGKPIPQVSGKTITIDRLNFSNKAGEKTEIPLRGETPAAKPASEQEDAEMQSLAAEGYTAAEIADKVNAHRQEVEPRKEPKPSNEVEKLKVAAEEAPPSPTKQEVAKTGPPEPKKPENTPNETPPPKSNLVDSSATEVHALPAAASVGVPVRGEKPGVRAVPEDDGRASSAQERSPSDKGVTSPEQEIPQPPSDIEVRRLPRLPRPSTKAAIAEARRQQENLVGGFYRSYGGGIDEILRVEMKESGPVYTVRNTESGEQRKHTTLIDPRSVAFREPAATKNAPADGESASKSPRGVTVLVPGENTTYAGQYEIRDLDQVQPSHNPYNFEKNAKYAHQNDRDYADAQNAARVIENAGEKFNPEYMLSDSPTAEHGAPVIDADGNVLGGNNRTMTLARVYQRNPRGAVAYRKLLALKAKQFGLDPEAVHRMKRPVLVRRVEAANSQSAITDLNKKGSASLRPAEQAVTDGKRLSSKSIEKIVGRIEDQGESASLADALRGDDAVEVIDSLIADGVVTEQEKAGLLDHRGHLTAEAKARIAKALVGRLFPDAASLNRVTPEMRNKLERIAPSLLRMEGRGDWALPVADALGAIEDARSHRTKNLDDLAAQTNIDGRKYDSQVIAVAKKLQESPVKAAAAFRRYANDEALSRDGAQASFFEPPTPQEAFDDAFKGEVRLMRPFPNRLVRNDSTPEKVARDAMLIYRPSRRGRPGILYGNQQAIEILVEVAKLTDGPAGGVYAPAGVADTVLERLTDAIEEYGAEIGPHIKRLRDEFEKAARDPRGVVVVDAGYRRTLRSVKSLVRHELHHAHERDLTPDSATAFLEEPAAAKAASELLQYGYPDDPVILASEIGAHLAEGPRGWGAINIRNADAAAALWRLYLEFHPGVYANPGVYFTLKKVQSDDSTEAHTPPESSGSRQLRTPDDRGGRTGSRGFRGGVSETVQRGTATHGGATEGLRFNRSQQGAVGRRQAASLFGEELSEPQQVEASEDQPGLFDAGEERQSRDDSRKDQAQLDKRRAETVFNSPLPTSYSAGPGDLFDDQQGFWSKLLNDESGEFDYSALAPRVNAAAADLADRWRGFEDKAVRNLSKLERVSPKAHRAAVQTASSRAQVAVLLRGAVPKIEKALLQSGGPSWADFRRTLVESRLQGIRRRWQESATVASRITDERLERSFASGGLVTLLDHVEGKRQFPQDLSQTAAALLASKNYEDLRKLLAQTFKDAANQVTHVMDETEFQRNLANPGFQSGLAAYRDLLAKPMADNHAINEGVFSDALGPAGVYYPLSVVEKPADPGDPGSAPQRAGATPYGKPKNILNDFATGLAKDYDLGLEALSEKLMRAIRGNNKAALVRTLEEEGLVQVLKPEDRAGDFLSIDGAHVPAVRMTMRHPRVMTEQGRSRRVEGQDVLLPVWLAQELRPILEKQAAPMEPGLARRILGAATAYALQGPLDFVWHSTNLIGTLIANTPFVGESLLAKTAGNTPATKWLTAIVRTLSTDPTQEEAIRDLTEMAKLGLVPDKFASETVSKRFAEQTGSKLSARQIGPITVPYSFGAALYGPKGIDVRARLIMYRIGLEIYGKDATPLELYHFVNQLGQYNKELAGSIERALKGSGASPFYTAGSTMFRNGINAVFGTGPSMGGGGGAASGGGGAGGGIEGGRLIASQLGYRLAQQLSGGILGAVAFWAVVYRAYRGKWPWEEKESKLMEIPLLSKDRNSDLGKALFGTRRGTAYVSLAFFNPIVVRGGRGAGAKGAYDTAMIGGSAGQMAEAAQKDILNGILHPALSGPAAKAAFVGIGGVEPYIVSLRDFGGRFGPELMPHGKKTAPGWPTLRQNVGGALLGLNPVVERLAEVLGFGAEHGGHGGQNRKGNVGLRMAVDLAMPRLVGTVQDRAAAARRLQKERRVK